MVSLPRESAMSLLPVSLASPVYMIAPPTTKSPIIMMTMGEEKPASASAGVRIPRTRSAARAVSATMSALTLPQMNRATVITKMISVVVMCFFWLQIYGNKVRIKNLREEKSCIIQRFMLTLQTKKVSNMTKKGKHTVLFICLGNICRSPAAEGIMKTLVEKAGLQDEFEIDSAGIGGWHVGQLPDSRMRKCGAEHGYNFNSHARQFQKSDFARFETIVVMDNENYRAITSMASSEADRKKVVRMADFLTHHREYTTVPDPYYGDYSDFELVITLLEDACQELLDSIIGEG